MVKQHDKFEKRDAVVLAVYPAETKKDVEFYKKTIKEETKQTKFPFPVLLDEELKVVKSLGIADERAKPSTYILDKTGQIRFAYVGATMSDRPSIQAMLDQLDAISSSEPPTGMP